MAQTPRIDPALDNQLYGEESPDVGPPPTTNDDPWSWVPSQWQDPEEIARARQQALQPSGVPLTAGGQPGEVPAAAPDMGVDLAAEPPAPPTDGRSLPFSPPDAQPPSFGVGVGGVPAAAWPTTVPAPESLPPPDASTGAEGGVGSAPELARAQGVAADNLHFQNTLQQYGDNPLAIPDDREQARALDMLPDTELAALQIREDAARAAYIDKRRREIADADMEAQRQHYADKERAYRDAETKSAAIDAEVEKLRSTKIDPVGGLSRPQLLAGVVSSIIGGLVQGRTGSQRNAGLDDLNATIDRGIAIQETEIKNGMEGVGQKRSALAASLARLGDLDAAKEALRRASLQHAYDQLSTEEMNYDPRGTTALRIAMAKRGIVATQQQAKAAGDQKRFENSLKLQDAARQQQIADETARNNRQQIGLAYAQLDSAKADRQAAAEQRIADKQAERADKEAERDRQFAVGAPDGSDLRNADGSVWRVADPQARKELGDKITAAKSLVKLYDRALAIRDRVGGESGAFNSPERQELDQIEAEVKILRKQGTQGMSSDADMDNLAQAGGAKDIASFRSKSPGIEVARARLQDMLNDALRTARYKGPPITFPKAPVTTNTPEEDRLQTLLQKPSGGFPEEFAAALGERRRGLSPDEARAFGPPLSADRIRAAGGYDLNHRRSGRSLVLTPQQDEVFREVAAHYDPDVSAAQRGEVARLGVLAEGTSPEAAKARADLEVFASKASSKKLADLARAALSQAAFASIPGEPEKVR